MDRVTVPRSDLPLLYSCSGCSNLAQLANHVAVSLDRAGQVEMSCIAGVGGDVRALVRVATSGRPTVVLDGCALACARSALSRHGVTPAIHHVLSSWGLAKRQHEDFTPEQAAATLARVRLSLPGARTGAFTPRGDGTDPHGRNAPAFPTMAK